MQVRERRLIQRDVWHVHGCVVPEVPGPEPVGKPGSCGVLGAMNVSKEGNLLC